MKKLKNLQWSPKWVSHLGCVKGCLDYLGINMTDAWLYGGTGHAFILNIHESVCPSGPTAWHTMMLFEGGENLGYAIEGVFGWKGAEVDFSELQKKAWSFTKNAIDQNIPVYGWELEIPEFYVVNGYDSSGYYYSGPGVNEGKGPKSWHELGDTGIGVIEIYKVTPGKVQADEVIVKKALMNVLKHASNPPGWIGEGYASGIKGYDNWIHALEGGNADRFGVGYNGEVWLECRRFAVGFLQEATNRLAIGKNGEKVRGLFAKCIQNYQVVVDCLSRVVQHFPYKPDVEGVIHENDDKCQAAVQFLKEARQAETAGLESLAEIVEVL